jgi:murein DD-endopeptidase MepM/ murein hydrolase activator NlpD
VVSGDTLGSIARRANSSVNELAAGNCLTNANAINVGQILRVPRAVSAQLPPTMPPTTGLQQIGSLYISSYIGADAGNYQLLRGDTITLRWDNAPANIVRVAFLLRPPGGRFENLAGDDTNPADGWQIQWTVPGGVNAELGAFAYRADGTMTAYSQTASVYSVPAAGQGCEIAPSNPGGLTVYTQSDLNSPVFGTLAQGQYVELLGRSLNGWYGFDPGVAQAGNTGAARLRWIPLDSALSYRGSCATGGDGGSYYRNPDIGIALYYPTGWTTVSDANYIDFKGQENNVIEINFGQAGQGRPPADVANECKNTTACIGNRTVLNQSVVTLAGGFSGVRLDLSGDPSKGLGPTAMVFLLVNNRNLVVRGFGDLSYFNPLLNSIRST